MKEESSFKPFISADRIMPEFTATSIILGLILAVVFGAANAYLGLRVGLTISASIPAAVISMGVIRLILKKDSILENNIVQTIGSAANRWLRGRSSRCLPCLCGARNGEPPAPRCLRSPSLLSAAASLGYCS